MNILNKGAFIQPNLLRPDSAWIGHIPFAGWIMEAHKPSVFVELGTQSGVSYSAFCQAVVENNLSTACYAVDTWEGDVHASYYGENIYTEYLAYHQRHFSSFSQLLRMTFDEANLYFSDNSIDLLHIDGLHTYDAVKHDFETWLPKMSERGVILFHDTNVRERNFGVWKLWEELSCQYPSIEFKHWHGLGVLLVGSNIPKNVCDFFNDNTFRIWAINNFFPRIAESISLKVTEMTLLRSVEERDGHIANLNQILTERDGHIANLNQIMAERDGYIANLNQVLIGRDEHIANLNQMVVERDGHIANLNQILTERDGHIANLNQIVVERDKHIKNLNEKVGDYEEHVANLNQVLVDLTHSTSWRLTKPLRFISRQMNKVFKVVSLPTKILKQHGIRLTVIKIARILKHEGISGIRFKLRLIGAQYLKSQSHLFHHTSKDFVENRVDYAEWVRRYDTLDENKRRSILSEIQLMPYRPKISIILPVYDPPLDLLEQTIRSVRNQLYPNWELCIADDASKTSAIHELLQKHASEESRIRLILRPENGHISRASNSALELATGEFIALLDHDDLLSEHALFWVAETITKHSKAGLIYSDEDKIDLNGCRTDPYFKPDWNYDLFLSHNVIAHLCVYRTTLVRELGGWRVGFEGAQDYDLALRCVEQIKSEEIIHIPRVLYHWRIHPASTASSVEVKPYAMLNGELALNEHLARRNIAGKAEYLGYGYRINYVLPEAPPLVSIIIPTRNGLSFLRQCVNSILEKTSYLNYEIIVIDNGSDESETLEYFKQIELNQKIRIIRDDRPFNYSALNNAAVKLAQGELVALVNNDIEVISENWLTEMVSLALQPGVGAVGARLLYPNDSLQHGGIILGIGGVAGHSHKYFPKNHFGYFTRMSLISSFSAVTAACLLVRKSIYEEVGGLNENELKVAFNDVDFCLRVREAGYRNIWTPYAELYHHESATRGSEKSVEKQVRFIQEVLYLQTRWGKKLVTDPAYNPNLTLDHEDFSFAWPPRDLKINQEVVVK